VRVAAAVTRAAGPGEGMRATSLASPGSERQELGHLLKRGGTAWSPERLAARRLQPRLHLNADRGRERRARPAFFAAGSTPRPPPPGTTSH